MAPCIVRATVFWACDRMLCAMRARHSSTCTEIQDYRCVGMCCVALIMIMGRARLLPVVPGVLGVRALCCCCTVRALPPL